jgi:hypothetical protein
MTSAHRLTRLLAMPAMAFAGALGSHLGRIADFPYPCAGR